MRGGSTLVGVEDELSQDEMDRVVAILDRLLDLAVSLNWPLNRNEFLALQEQLAEITGLPRPK